MFDELDAMCPPEPKIEEEAPIVEASPSETRAQIERAHKQRGKLNLGIKVYREGYNHRSHMTTKHLSGGNFNLLEPGESAPPLLRGLVLHTLSLCRPQYTSIRNGDECRRTTAARSQSLLSKCKSTPQTTLVTTDKLASARHSIPQGSMRYHTSAVPATCRAYERAYDRAAI
jgi:hypothetical protein